MMDDEAARTRTMKLNHWSIAIVYEISVCITGSLVIMVMLLWAICSGFKLIADSSRYTLHTDWAFHIGVITMLFGFLFLLLGIPILVDLFLNLSEQLQEEAGIHQGLTRMKSMKALAAREIKTISKVIAQIIMTAIIMILLCWAIYTGFRLATEPRSDGKYYLLTISIGVVTVIFGFVYFIIELLWQN